MSHTLKRRLAGGALSIAMASGCTWTGDTWRYDGCYGGPFTEVR